MSYRGEEEATIGHLQRSHDTAQDNLMIIIILGLNAERCCCFYQAKNMLVAVMHIDLWKYKNSDVKRKLDQLLLCNINVGVKMDSDDLGGIDGWRQLM